MEKIKIGSYEVLRMDQEEMNAPELKNEFMTETNSKYIGFICDSISEADLCEKLSSMNRDGIIVIYKRQIPEKVTYEDVFLLEESEIEGLLFPKKILAGSGNFHPYFDVDGNMEFLCRVVEKTGQCCVVTLSSQKSDEISQGNEMDAYVFAYIVRRHMASLHKRGITDQVFQKLCGKMQEKGIFEIFQNYLNYFLSNEGDFQKMAMPTAPFLVMRGDDTCMGVLQQFSDDLAEALEEEGQAVIQIGEDENQYDELQGQVYQGIVGFQTRALEMDFFRKMVGPKFQYWLDYPLHFQGILRDLPEEYYVLCQDSDHAKQIRDYYNTRNALQFPPGGKCPDKLVEIVNDGETKTEPKVEERPLDIVFIGSNFKDEADGLSDMQKRFYLFMLEHCQMTFEAGLQELLKDQAPTQEQFMEIMREMKSACRAVIGHFREKVIRTILETGAQLHVYGDDWKEFDGEYTNLIVHPQVTVEESIKELQKAKIGLNIMSWHKGGMTERLANIMLTGAMCLSDTTSYLRENHADGEDVVLFELDQMDQLKEKIQDLLQIDQRRTEIARAGQKIALEEYTWKKRAKQLIALAKEYRDNLKEVQIYVATHVAFQPPVNPIYIPIHVGKKGKPDLGYLGDDTGENISDLNFLYGELTGLFWIWQNVQNADYVGMCHYRRYFMNSQTREILQKHEYLELLKNCDAIVPKHMECENGLNYAQHFALSHNIRDLNAVEHALKKLFPEYAAAYDQAMQGNIYYWGNLVVTSLSILQVYSEWLFTIFMEAGEEIDVTDYDAYHKRVYGFLSEQMFYVFALANGLELTECAVGVSGEKAETGELKEKLQKLLSEGKKEEAKQIWKKEIANRPDLLLPGSDVSGELKRISEKLM